MCHLFEIEYQKIPVKRDIIGVIRLNLEEDLLMGDTNSIINVTFLGGKLFIPRELVQYVTYCNEFEKISDRLMNKLLVTMKKKTNGRKVITLIIDMHEKFEVDFAK